MGIELQGDLGDQATDEAIRNLFDSLQADSRWRLVRRDDDNLALAYNGEPVNPSWPESVVVQVMGSRIHITFHVGTASQRGDFLDAITRILESAGIRCQLNEV